DRLLLYETGSGVMTLLGWTLIAFQAVLTFKYLRQFFVRNFIWFVSFLTAVLVYFDQHSITAAVIAHGVVFVAIDQLKNTALSMLVTMGNKPWEPHINLLKSEPRNPDETERTEEWKESRLEGTVPVLDCDTLILTDTHLDNPYTSPNLIKD